MKQVLTAILAAVAVCAQAAAPSDYDSQIYRVLERGCGLRGDSLRMQAGIASVCADNALEGPEAEFEHLWPSGGGRARWSASVSQSFEWAGLYAARRRSAEASRAEAAVVIESITLDKALSVKQLIIDIVNARQRVDMYEGIGRNLERVDSLTRRAYELDDATILDVRKMQLAVLDNRRETAAARADLLSLTASLEAMGGTVGENWTEYPMQAMSEPSDNPLDYPEYRVMAVAGLAAREAASVARGSGMPRFSLGFVHAFEEGTHFNGLSVSVGLPSWSVSARRRAADLEAAAVAADGEAAFMTALAERRGLYMSARVLGADLAAYRELTADDGYLDLLRKAFDGGELSVIDYLNEVMLFIRARLSYIDLDYRYNLTLARLNRTRGIGF